MLYTINYNIDGYPGCLTRSSDNASIPLDERNSDFVAFLEWNAQQVEPLDWKTPKEMPAPPPNPLTADERLDKLLTTLVTKKTLDQVDMTTINTKA